MNRTQDVIFRMEDNKPIAVFPNEVSRNGKVSCYTFSDGHSTAHKDYIRKCPPAKIEQYLPMYNHLTSIGYNLKVKTIRTLK